jgi:hypothetical protein
MRIDTKADENWTPYRALALMSLWIVAVLLIAFAIGGCRERNPPPPPQPGAISLAWSITDRSGATTTCAAVNARSVALRLRNRSGGEVVATAVPCQGSPATAPVAPGVYDVAIELHAASGATLATTPDQRGITIRAGQVAPLAPAVFAVNAQSTLVLSIATPATTNCDPTGRNGAGITGMLLTLQGSRGCEPVTFARALGGADRGTYTVDCSAPSVMLCVEKTETLITHVDPGTYTLHVVGKRQALDCWQRDDTLVVTVGRPLIHRVGLVRRPIAEC